MASPISPSIAPRISQPFHCIPQPPPRQALLVERARLVDEVDRLREQAQRDAAALRERGEALARSEAELRAAQLELQLRSRQAAHEEGLTRDTLRQQEASLVGVGASKGVWGWITA